jgi:16S rRNA (cytosine1402-N4)-methyltransferase
VLLNEVLDALLPNEKQWPSPALWVDATCGLGGHAAALLARLPAEGHLLALDRDSEALAASRHRLQGLGFQQAKQFTLVQTPFAEVARVLEEKQLGFITGGVLADIGVSSLQLDKAERGFSFRKAAPLDMRMNPEAGLSVRELLAQVDETQLTRIIKDYGEERFAKPLAQAILARRATMPLSEWNTVDLAKLAEEVYKQFGQWPPKRQKGKAGERGSVMIHPATRLFQALRIWVNDELGQLQALLESFPAVMASGARVAIISFHSLEDRLVKQWFAVACKGCVCPPRFPACMCGQLPTFKPVSRKVIMASQNEQAENPRSRSAKLRVYERL